MTDTSTADALAALRAAEAQLEATLAGEKGDAPVMDTQPAPEPELSTPADGEAGAAPAVAQAPVSHEIKLGPTVVG